MKKKLFAASIVTICLAAVGYGTLAYVTDEAVAHNIITSGGVDVEIVEKQDTGEDFPEDGVHGVMPGGTVSKIVTVKNDENSSEAWIRVSVELAITEGADSILDLNPDKLPLTVTNAEGEEIDIIRLDFNKEYWIQGADGYWYYKDCVVPNASTEPLFKTVYFAPEMDNTYQNCKITVDINAQAVQVANNPIPEGKDVTAIPGWPES